MSAVSSTSMPVVERAAFIRAALECGESWVAIASRLGVSQSAAYEWATRNMDLSSINRRQRSGEFQPTAGIKLATPIIERRTGPRSATVKNRRCLTCRREFRSEGWSHRICSDCKSNPEFSCDPVHSLAGVRM